MAAALVPLQNITLGSNQSSVTFASIPGTFRDLRLVVNGSMSSPASPAFRLNGDSTSGNYHVVTMWGTGSAAQSTSNSTYQQSALGWFTSAPPTGLIITATLDVFDYAQTNKQKSSIARGNDTTYEVTATAGRWASTAAVTSLTVTGYAGGGTWAAGSTFALYGVVS